MTRRSAAFLLCLIGVAACRESGAEGEFYAVSGKLFIFNYRVARATYLVTLRPLKPMRDGDVAVAVFEDPAGGSPIEVRQKIWPRLDKVSLESPPVHCVRKDRPYQVSIRIEAANGAVRQTIATTMTSSEDQTRLPDKPLVVGPFYTPNPEVNDRSGGAETSDPPPPVCPTDP